MGRALGGQEGRAGASACRLRALVLITRPLSLTACCILWCRLPTSHPTWGQYMTDSSKLQRSTVSLQAAVSLMPPTVSTQRYGSGPRRSGLSDCQGRCVAGLCSVDFKALHCCVAKGHDSKKHKGELGAAARLGAAAATEIAVVRYNCLVHGTC